MSTAGVFRQRGNTVRLVAHSGPVAPRAIQAPSTGSPQPPGYDFTFTNLGPSLAFVGVGATEAAAIANAQAPSEGTGGEYCLVLAPGQRSYEADPNSYFAAVTPSGTADIFITPGKGPADGFTGDLLNGTTSDTAIILAKLDGIGEQLRGLLVELMAQTFYMREGFIVMDEPDLVRRDADKALVK